MSVFEALPDEPIEAKTAPESQSVPTGRLGNGEIKQAVVKVLVAADGPMQAVDIYPAVERLLGRDVLKDSVYSCLSRGGAGRSRSSSASARAVID
jgi:hypothetical protein